MHTGDVPSLFLRRTPTATQFYCEVCGVFATSEEQLVMHNEGKKHKRSVALKELTHGHLPSIPPDSTTGTNSTARCVQLSHVVLILCVCYLS